MTTHIHFSRLQFFIAAFFLVSLAAGCAGTGDSHKTALSESFNLIAAPQTIRSDEVTLVWDKLSGQGASSVTYQILCDGKSVGTTSKTYFTVKQLVPSRDYAFVIKAEGALRASTTLHIQTKGMERVLNVVDYGALGDGVSLNTKALQAAINACPANGIVYIPKGIFLSGALFLKSDMSLYIAAGGVLKGSGDIKDYEPFIRNRFEGWEMDTYASLLNAGVMDHKGAANVRNVSIRGEGTISGGGRVLGQAMRDAHGLRGRGRLICLMNCANVEIQGLTIEESPCWTLHYIYSENVTFNGLTIRSDVRNGDGIDPDSSKNSYILNCSFDTGDDCIAIKSGKNPEGNVINRPTENVQIIGCNFIRGHGISIGSEMSGGVRGVLVQDCVAGNLMHGMQIKATRDRGNVVEDVIVRDCDLQKISILTELNYNNDGQAAPEQPYFRNFRFQNLDLSKAKPSSVVIIVNGYSEAGHRTKNVVFENVKLPAGAIVEVDQAEDVRFTNVITSDGQMPVYNVTKSERISK